MLDLDELPLFQEATFLAIPRAILRRVGCLVLGHDWFAINDRDRKCLRCGLLEAEPWSPNQSANLY